VVTPQIASGALEHVDRRQRERAGAAHAAAECRRVFRPGVLGAERPNARQLVVCDRRRPRGEIIFTVASQHLG